MGLLSWLFPSDEDRVAKARRLLADGRWSDARLEILDIERPDAQQIVREAEGQLAQLNLDAALSWAEAGDEHRVQVHLELAEDFHHGGLEESFRTVRRRIRELRAAQSEEEKRAREEKAARLLSVDPFGMSGSTSLLRAPIPEGMDAEDALELAARLDLLLENYPEDLRSRVEEVGAPFAQAVLDLDGGRPDLALQALLGMDPDHPLVVWEMARAAAALGDPVAAARTLDRFAGLAPGHRQFGQQHSGTLLAQLHAEAGDVPRAIEVLRAVRADEPEEGGFLYAQLLTATGALQEAETIVRGLLRKNGRVLPFYALLARIRLLGGYRVEAMAALEKAMAQTCGTPGKCGYMPPDPAIVRQLATLYLEDGIEPERALELARQARQLSGSKGFEDLYLDALVARAEHHAQADDLVAQVWRNVPDGDPRRAHLGRYLPLPA